MVAEAEEREFAADGKEPRSMMLLVPDYEHKSSTIILTLPCLL